MFEVKLILSHIDISSGVLIRPLPLLQPPGELSLVEVSVAVGVDTVTMLLIITPLPPVVTAIQEPIHSLAIEGIITPLSLVILGLHATRLEAVLTPNPICHHLIVDEELATAVLLPI